MKLAADEPRVIWQLDDLDESTVWREPGERHPGRLQLISVLVVEFKAVAVTLSNQIRTVGRTRTRFTHHATRISAEPHGATLICEVLLFVEERDAGMRRVRIELGLVCSLKAE